MAKKENLSITQRLGGNRSIVLVIVILMLILFTVEAYVVPALGGGAGSSADFVRYTVDGNRIEISREKLETSLGNWQRFHNGQSMITGRPRGGGMNDYLQDAMMASMARSAGLSVPDDSVREFIRTHPLFHH